MEIRHLLIILCIGLQVVMSTSEDNMVNIKNEKYFNEVEKLQMKLLKDYNLHVRPAIDYRNTIDVNVSMYLLHMSLDEDHSQLSLYNYFLMTWRDERLKWEPSDYNGLNVLHIPSQLVWTPDITLYTSLMGNLNHDFGDVNVLIYPDGTILHVPPAKFEVPCPMDFRYWPYDQQKCRIKIGSWTYHGHQININSQDPSKTIDLTDFIETENWKLINISANFKVSYYPCCVEPYPSMEITVTLQRNSSLFQYSTLASSFVIGLLTLATLCLPFNTVEKLAISLVDLLVIFICQMHLKDIIPARGHHLPIIVSVYNYTAVFVALSVVVTVLTMKWTRCRPLHEPPQWARLITGAFLGPILCVADESAPVSENKSSETDEIHRQWMTLGRILDRFVSVLFFAVLAVVLVNPIS